MAKKAKAREEAKAKKIKAKEEALAKKMKAKEEALAKKLKAKEDAKAKKEKAKIKTLEPKSAEKKDVSLAVVKTAVEETTTEVAQITTMVAQASIQKKNEPSKPEDFSEEMTGYIRSVQQQIAEKTLYPAAAKEAKAEGTVELRLTIIKSGTLVSASVKKSSGSTILDNDALEVVRSIASFGAFPSSVTLKHIIATIPIVYQLD